MRPGNLRWFALLLLAVAALYWAAAGANRGWTKTRVPVKQVDAVTGIEGIEYQRRFVPGLDFLGAALLAAGLVAGGSLLVRSKPATETQL